MTEYQKKRRQEFFTSYPTQSIRFADRLEAKLWKDFGNYRLIRTGEEWPSILLRREIDPMRQAKIDTYQETGRWI